jgi:tRNA threonylcarbamoyladenosine biosynthesis protein TsaE
MAHTQPVQIIELPDLSATDALGRALSGVLPDGAVVALNGPLGAGKTRLVQAIAAAEGVPAGSVTSPTFVMVNEYQGRRPIYHFDAYRIRDDDEFLALGPDEYFEGRGLTLVEWAERVERCLPRERLEVRLHVTGDADRRAEIAALGPQYAQALEALAATRVP